MNDKSRSRLKTIVLFVFGTFIAVNAVFLLLPGVFDILSLRLNDKLFDLRQAVRGHEPVYGVSGEDQSSSMIVMVELDDRGYDIIEELKKRYGSDRVFDGDVINALSGAGVRMIGYDAVFATEGGQRIVDATKKAGNVYYPVILSQDEKNALDSALLSESVWNMKARGQSPPEYFVRYSTKPALLSVAKGVPQINMWPDDDGIYRRVPLLIRTREGYYPSLGLAMAADYLGVDPGNMEVDFGKKIVLKGAAFPDGTVKDIAIPIDGEGNMVTNFAGQWLDVFRHISFVDILQVIEDRDLVELLSDEVSGKMIIVADVSSAGKDFEAVPINEEYPLSNVHANVLNSILTDNFIYEMPVWMQIVLSLIIAAVICVIALRTKAFVFFAATIAVFILYMLFAGGMFVYGSTMMNTIPTALSIIFAFVLVAVYRYLLEEQEKTMMYETFKSYFAPSVMDKILSDPVKLESSQRKELTVLFTDISGFTAWSSTREPEEIHSTLNEYYSEMARVVFKYEGTIDKYMGDGMLAFFGDPVDYDDHPVRAVRAAVEMQTKAKQLGEEWESQGRLRLQTRIGINTGEVVVGNMGSENRIDYTVLGSNVNLAQRLEDNCPLGSILISQPVYDYLQGNNLVDSLGAAVRPYASMNIEGTNDQIQVYQIEI